MIHFYIIYQIVLFWYPLILVISLAFPPLNFFQKDQPDDDELPKISNRQILKMNKPEWKSMVIGAIASVIMGASMPAYAVLFGEVR